MDISRVIEYAVWAVAFCAIGAVLLVGLMVVAGLVIGTEEEENGDEVCDRDRSRECRDMAAGMETTKDTKGTK